MEEKDTFRTDLDEVVESIPNEERVVIGAESIGHVGEGNRGDENVMGRYGDKARNTEGQMVVDFATRIEMAVVNIYFKKREGHKGENFDKCPIAENRFTSCLLLII